MKRLIGMPLALSVVAIVAVMLLGQASGQPTLKQKILSGGSYQIADVGNAPCSGQCVFPNWQTNACTCPEGFAPVNTARTLIDVVNAQQQVLTCGANLVSCVAQ